MGSLYGYGTVKYLQLYWLLLCLEFSEECFDHEGVINGHIFLPNNRKMKSGKNQSFWYAVC